MTRCFSLSINEIRTCQKEKAAGTGPVTVGGEALIFISQIELFNDGALLTLAP